MFEYFLKSVAVGDSAEFVAALAGTFFLALSSNPPKALRQFAYFMWFIMISEILGFYSIYAYITEYVTLPFIKGTPFVRGFWMYNVCVPFTYCFYILFFRARLKSEKKKKWIKYGVLFFLGSTLINWIFSGGYLYMYSSYTAIIGTLLLSLTIMAYLWEILISPDILLFYKRFSFYAAVGILLRYLVVTPLFIYATYFSLENPDFIRFYTDILAAANVFMYGSFTLGFILCYRNRNSYSFSIL